jgi:dienelactone hydrolase
MYVALWLLVPCICAADQPAMLPGTEPLQTAADLSVQIVDEAHKFLDRKTAESIAARAKHWHRDSSSPAAYEKSIQPNRQRLMKYIGLIDPRVPVVMERFGDEQNPALVAETDRYRIYQVRWPVLEGVDGEGLLLEPKTPAVAQVVALPDADQTPEQLVGLAPGVAPESQFARRLAENGFRVVVPTLIDRSCRFSGNPRVAMTNQPHREWIYRQAYEMGRHVIGYEVQKILSVVDWFEKSSAAKAKIAVAGYGEGGLLAFYAAAVDPRIDVCLTSGYFDSRQRVWQEPIYRNVWGLLDEFGDAKIASLIVPRTLVVEYSPVPKIDGPPPVEAGRRSSAAPGKFATPPLESILGEFGRATELDQGRLGTRHIIHGPDSQPLTPGAAKTLQAFAAACGTPSDMPLSADLPRDRRTSFDPVARQKRQVEQLSAHAQLMMRQSDQVRDEFLLNKVSLKSAEDFTAAMEPYREIFWSEVIGPLDDPLVEPKPKSRKIYDEPKWTGYDVVLDVWSELHAWGILLLPKDLKPGEKRPVVVCQHGLEGEPKVTIEPKDTQYYRSYAAKLADRGFVVFSPYNLYRGGDRFRMLQRKANPLKASLFSILILQHEQILKWLGSRPEVDPSRIAFYGLRHCKTINYRIQRRPRGWIS